VIDPLFVHVERSRSDMAFSSTDTPAPENDNHAARAINRNFSAVMAMSKTVNITPIHWKHIYRPCLHNRWVAMWARAAEHIMCRIG